MSSRKYVMKVYLSSFFLFFLVVFLKVISVYWQISAITSKNHKILDVMEIIPDFFLSLFSFFLSFFFFFMFSIHLAHKTIIH